MLLARSAGLGIPNWPPMLPRAPPRGIPPTEEGACLISTDCKDNPLRALYLSVSLHDHMKAGWPLNAGVRACQAEMPLV